MGQAWVKSMRSLIPGQFITCKKNVTGSSNGLATGTVNGTDAIRFCRITSLCLCPSAHQGGGGEGGFKCVEWLPKCLPVDKYNTIKYPRGGLPCRTDALTPETIPLPVSGRTRERRRKFLLGLCVCVCPTQHHAPLCPLALSLSSHLQHPAGPAPAGSRRGTARCC